MKTLKIALITIIAALATLTLVSCGNNDTDTSGCYSDIDLAFKAAQKQNKDLIIFVTANGDDANSQSFIDTIIRNEKFKDEIASKYIAVRMDFSESSHKATVAEEGANDTAKKNAEKRADIMQRNTVFANLLNLTVTPMTFIFSKEKYLITNIYYDAGEKSYEEYKSLLQAKEDTIDSMHKMILATKTGTSEEKMQAIKALYEATAPEARHFLSALLSSAKKLDPTNKSGLLGDLVYAAADAIAVKAINTGDIKTAVDAYISLENETSVSPEDRQQAIYTAAYMLSVSELEEPSVVINYLERAIAVAPDSDEVPAINRIIQALSSQAE